MMEFVRVKPNANSENINQRYTELSDTIRARNKREERLLNVRLRCYEHEKNIRLNIIHKEQKEVERVKKSLVEQAKKIQIKKQNRPVWMSSKAEILQLTPELTFTDWELNSEITQSQIISFNTTPNAAKPTDVFRRHSAR